MCYVSSVNLDLSQESTTLIRNAFSDVIEGRMTFVQCSNLISPILGTNQPLKKLQTILATPDEPIPLVGGFDMGSESTRRKTRSWTQYEDQRLIAGIHRFGCDNWAVISNFVGNGRTRAQCCQRWHRGLDPRISKDHWKGEDNQRLIDAIIKEGSKGWTQVAQAVGNRSDVQCRYHFMQLMREGGLPDEVLKVMDKKGKYDRIYVKPQILSSRVHTSKQVKSQEVIAGHVSQIPISPSPPWDNDEEVSPWPMFQSREKTPVEEDDSDFLKQAGKIERMSLPEFDPVQFQVWN